jgi:type I restriction enzyme S subunit
MKPADGPVPRLRFPEFRDAGPWEMKRLEKYVEQRAGNANLIKGRLYAEPGHGRFPGFSASGQDVWLDGYENEGSAIIVSAVGARCGRCFFANGKWSAIANTHVLIPKEGEIDIRFLLLTVTRDGYWIISGSGQPFVKVRESLRQGVPLPSLSEQHKIADCLTSLDELIRAEGERLGALRDHKRGLMQRLFPRPGETTPRLRFPEFRDAGLWEVKRLSEVCEINPPSGELPESFIYIDLESVSAGELLQKKVISRNEAPSRAQRLLSPGDIIYQMVRPYQRNNLLFAIVGDMKYVASTGYAQLRAKSSAEFLFQLVHTDSFVGSVLQKCTGSNYPAINPSDLGEIHVSVPSNPEQHRIADCLASLDELIRAQGERLAALKAHKRGLMQQLFPQGLA